MSFDDLRRNMRGVLDRVMASILTHGWGVLHVLGMPPFSYTVGLSTTLGAPEVLVAGLPPDVAESLLNALGARIQRDGVPPLETDIVGLLEGNVPMRLRSRGRYTQSGHCHVAAELRVQQGLSQDFEVLQLLFPDSEGRWPDEPGSRTAGQLLPWEPC